MIEVPAPANQDYANSLRAVQHNWTFSANRLFDGPKSYLTNGEETDART